MELEWTTNKSAGKSSPYDTINADNKNYQLILSTLGQEIQVSLFCRTGATAQKMDRQYMPGDEENYA